jgi:acetylglutamate kinase
LQNGIVPVVPPLGVDGDGRTYRVNCDAGRASRSRRRSAR